VQIEDGGRKTETRTIFDSILSTSRNLPARFRGIADSLVLMSLSWKIQYKIAAAKPEIHI